MVCDKDEGIGEQDHNEAWNGNWRKGTREQGYQPIKGNKLYQKMP